MDLMASRTVKNPAIVRLPRRLARSFGTGEPVRRVRKTLRGLSLESVCEQARCPNLGECFGRGRAAFLILGSVCTRGCRFCGIDTGVPAPPDPLEPQRLSHAAGALGLEHVVVTSVTRDDLSDGGAASFVRTVEALRSLSRPPAVELLVPDFAGDARAQGSVFSAGPDVLNHNVETVPSLYSSVRPGADYERSLDLLSRAAASGLLVKSGLMVGLGETFEELEGLFADLARAGTHIVTVGQYLRPGRDSLCVTRYLEPEEFDDIRRIAQAAGIPKVSAAPLVRSSYRAEEALK